MSKDFDDRNKVTYKANGKKSLVKFKKAKTPYAVGDVAKIDQPLAEIYAEQGIITVMEKDFKPKKEKEENDGKK
ncbi:MAG: hypothetical protein C4519_24365 [Desulfobacteraceae bacterium]|nr:MAG: hypothetical protein C4519_24365 [Desulfobacteraceae bacterium]